MEKVLEKEYSVRRRTKWKRGLIIGVSVIAMLLIILSLVAFYIVQRSLPQIDGEKVVAGINAPVTVHRDKAGVPHIEADSPEDLYFAQGYVTAQDRLFQMDLSRRVASGRLSEVVGEATVDRDRFFRTLGLRRAAEASLDAYSSDARDVLDWYAEGVNAFIAEATKENRLPPEFTLLGYKPEEWSAVDSLAIAKYMAFDLGGHWEGQAFRQYLLQNFPEEKALELFPSYPKNRGEIIAAIKENPIDIQERFANVVVPEPYNGSNNWVVSGQKTESGLPLLANDPHLGLGTPSIWYESHLKTDDLNVSGVIFAGIPGIIVGHNEKIAWGVTNVGPDVQDLYIERRNSEDPSLFLYEGDWEKAELIYETIKVKDAPDVNHQVTITRHGPLISEFAHYDQGDQGRTELALKWTALEPSTELEAVLRMNRSENWEDFIEALTYFHTPAQNFVFASIDGDIAYRANGLIPIRKRGDGTVPMPGWMKEYEWEGYIPWDELPTVVNPEKGFIATANNKITGDDYPYHITNTWAQPYRYERIEQYLSGGSQWSAEDMKALQMDQYNLQAEEMLPILLPELSINQLNETEQNALTMLEEWNFEDSKDQGAPLLFHLWMSEISHVLFEGQIDSKMMKLFDGRAQVVDELIRKASRGEPSIWMDEAGGLNEVATKEYRRAVEKSTSLQGDDVDKWQWGKYHSLVFEHPLGSIKPLDLLFNSKPTEVGGSRVTVMAAGWDNQTGKVNHGAAWRTVVDFAEPSVSQNVVGPGQSGHALSSWYDDQIDDWVNGTYHTTSLDEEDYKNGEELNLLPAE